MAAPTKPLWCSGHSAAAPADNWEFVIGGKGYRGGLEELIREYGIDVGS